jgi:hypothetical protein
MTATAAVPPPPTPTPPSMSQPWPWPEPWRAEPGARPHTEYWDVARACWICDEPGVSAATAAG